METIRGFNGSLFRSMTGNLIFTIKPHKCFPVFTLHTRSSLSLCHNADSQGVLKSVFAGLKQVFNLIFVPEFQLATAFNDNYKSRPGWSVVLNLQHFGLEAPKLPSQIWVAYSEILETDASTFGFIYLQPWVFLSVLSAIDASDNLAENWIQNYQMMGHKFKPI